jgi:ankyrin repeat protein
MPRGLYSAFECTLQRIRSQSQSRSAQAMTVLMWTTLARRPLSVEELCQAVTVEVGDTRVDDEDIPGIRSLLMCCLGLVIVDVKSSTVRLMHYSLQEYLATHSGLFLNGHSSIAETCLTYLNFEVFNVPYTHRLKKIYPFLVYASCEWGNHVRQKTSQSMKDLAVKLLINCEDFHCPRMILFRDIHGYGSGKRFSGLHIAAFFGIKNVVQYLTREGQINSKDNSGRTALSYAASNGHEAVVRLLLNRSDINVNSSDGDGYTVLSLAAMKGHETIVRLLLDRSDINANLLDEDGNTVLSRAVLNGHKAVVRLLLNRNDMNINVNLLDEDGNTAMMRLLLDRNDINVNLLKKDGNTALSLAAENGHEAMVRLLLDRNDINVNLLDEDGNTTLSLAASKEHEAVVRLLLD